MEAERYREAAEQTLGQLDWVIAYLYQIKKPGIAKALLQNREQIGSRLG
jgi:dTDP-glucose pyrophosphorylase